MSSLVRSLQKSRGARAFGAGSRKVAKKGVDLVLEHKKRTNPLEMKFKGLEKELNELENQFRMRDLNNQLEEMDINK